MAARTVFIDSALSNYQSVAAQYDAAVFNVVLLNSASPHAEQIQNWMKSNGVNAADINIVSASTSVNGAFTPRVVFVDSSIADLGTVIAGVPANATVVVLDAGRDGVQQIHDYLAANGGKVGAIDIVTDLASVDVVSHGAPGQVMLGSTVLNADTLAQYSSQLAEIGSHLTAGADLLLYGCDVASGATGQQFITALAAATGADVAASTDLTGSAAAGGDWTLEASTGTIETAALNIAGYDALLAVNSVGSFTVSNGINITGGVITKDAAPVVSGTYGTNNTGNATLTVSINGGAKTDVTVTPNGNGGTFTFTLPSAADGIRNIHFFDGRGNGANDLGTLNVTVDTTLTAPTVALTTDSGNSSDRITNNAALTFNTRDSDAVRVIKVDGTAVGTYPPSPLSEGSHTVNVTDTDTAGNTKSATITFTLDTKAPTPTVALTTDTGKSSGDGITSNAALAIGSVEAGASRVIKVDGTTVTAYDASKLLDGPHTVSVTDTDTAGNAGTASATFTLDTKAPATTVTLATDTGASSTDGLTNNAALNFGALEAGATRVIKVDGVAGAYTPANLADGQHTVEVTDTDAAGNAGTSSVTFTLDTTLSTPTVTLVQDTGGSGSDGVTRNAALNIGAADPGAVRVIKLDNQVVSGYDPSGLAEGAHTVSITDTDAAGNTRTASAAFTLDTKAPVTSASLVKDTGTSGTDGLTSNAGVNFGALESGATRVVKVDGAVVAAYDPTKLADGQHTVEVADTDAAGNTGTSSVAFMLDKTSPAPTAPLAHDTGRSSQDGATSNAALTIAALEAGASRVIKVDGAVVAAYDPTALADGQHTVELADTDGAGNTGTSSTTFILDTKAPVPTAALTTDTGASGTDGLTRNAGLTLGTLETGAIRVITVDGTVVANYDAAALGDGEHTVDVADTDAAGNVGTASVTFTLDTTAPAPTAPLAHDTGRSDHDSITSNAALTVAALEAGASRVIKVDGTVVAAYDPTVLADGQHTVEVADTDGAGNTGTLSTTFTLDTKAPATAATLAADTGSNGTDGLTSNAGLSFGALEVGATRVITVDGIAVTAYDPTKLADGQHTVEVSDTDAAGNTGTSSAAFLLDTKAPTPAASLAHDTGSSTTDGTTSNAALTLAALETGATRVIKVDGAIVAAYDPATLADGSHTVELADTDGAGNTGTSSTTFILDTKAPVPTASLANDTGASGTDGLTRNAGLTLGALETGATRVITVDGTVVANYDAAALGDGKHTVDMADTDAAGNVGTASVTFTLDTTAPTPTAPLTHDTGSSSTDGVTSNAALTVAALEAGATRVIKVDGSVVAAYDPTKLADGNHTVELADTDGAGNTGTSSTTFTLDTKAPSTSAALADDTGSSHADGLTSNAGVNFGALETGATRVITVDGATVTAYDPTKLADGQHTVDVADTDAAGNVGKSSVAFLLDTKAPTPTSALADDTGGSETDGTTSNAALTLGALETGATRVIKLDGAVVTAYDPTSLADGQHTVELTDTDGAGNIGTASTTFVLDTKAPVPTATLANDTGTSDKDGLTSKAGLTLGALESGATRVITVDGTVVANYDASMLADGKHTVDVADTDVAGNVGKTSVTFILDTTAPTPTAPLAQDTGSSNTDGVTNDAALTIAALEAGATRVIKVDGKAVAAYDPTSLADGQHTVELADTDGAGNTGTSSTTFILDTKAPTVSATLVNDTGTSGTDGLTSNAGVGFGALEAGATRVITVDGAVVTAYDPTKLADGQHTVDVADTDAAGNVGKSSVAFLLDTKAPTPTSALVDDTGSSETDGTTSNAALTFGALEAGATRVIKVDGAVVTAYDPTKLADGSHTVELADTDGAGNTGTSSTTFTLDTKAPVTTATLATDTGTSSTDGLTSKAGLTLGALESGATRVITVDGTVVNSYDAAALADGKHTVDVADTDAAGNVGTASVTFTLDTAAPAPTAPLAHDTGSSSTDGVTSNAALTLAALEAGASRVIKVDGAVVAAYDPTKLADGNHTVELADTDGAGNTGTSSTTFTLDTKAPSTSAVLADDTGSSHADGLTSHAGVNLGALETGATRVITVDGAAVTAYDPTTLSDGQHTVQVADTDAAGNTGTSSLAFMLDTKAPTPAASLAHDTGSSDTDSTTSSAALTLAALETGATRVIKVDGAVVAAYDPTKLADGSHTVELADTDGAGNTGTSSTTFILDTKAPVTTAALATDTGASGTDGLTSKAGLTLGALETGATRVITVDGAVVNSYDAAALADGKHTVDVADTDAAGNVGTASVTFTLDTAAPAPTAPLAHDTGSSSTDGVTSNAALTVAALEAGATRVIKVDGAVVAAYDPTKLADGNHTVELADTDGAGNTGTSSTTFTLDTKAPSTSAALADDTGSSHADGLTSHAGVNFGALETGATRVITVDGAAVTAYDPTTLADGQHTVEVADTDAAGNTGTSSVAFMLDTKAPTPAASLAHDTGSSTTDGTTSNAALTLAALETGATRVIKVDGAIVAAYDPATLADGSHTVELADTDGAGNTGTSSTTFILDTKAPVTTAALSADTGTSDKDGVTSNAALSLGALESGATRVITVDGNVVAAYDATKLADGKHTVDVADTDAAGNVGKASVAFTLDTAAPAPTAPLAHDTGSSSTDGVTSNAALTVAALEAGATRVIKVDGAIVATYDPTKLADGNHTVELADTDAAGNTGTSSTAFTLDTKAPATSAALTKDTGGSDKDGLTSDAALTLGALESGATRVITVDGSVVGAYDASTLANGKHTVDIADTDAAGNVGKASVAFTLDTQAPTPTVKLATDSGANAADSLTNNAGLTIGALESGASRVVKVDGNTVAAYDPAALAEGQHTVEVTDTDGAGNAGKASATFTLDSKGPVFSSAGSATVAENIGENKLAYKALAADAHGVSFSLGGADAAKFDIAADGSVTLKENPNYEAVNAYAFTVVATDNAGNHTDQAVALAITNVNEAPVATSISKSTIENAQLSFQVADYISDPDIGDRLGVSLGTTTATLSWMNTDPAAPKTIINPVTKAVVDLSTLTVKASLSADGSTVTLTPPAELDWMATGQAVKASFSYTVTDAAGLTSQEKIDFVMNGSTNDKGVNLNGGNGDDNLAGNATNNAEDVLNGGNGNDTLSGFGGTDALYGGNGDDKLSGGAGIDYLYGDSGNDTIDGGLDGDYIFGGKGNDVLTGGGGADKFVFAPQGGSDRITDFKVSEGDKLYFADFFPTAITVDAFLQKYVTDTGNDLLINLQGTQIVLVGVANVSDLAGAISFGVPA